MKLKLSKRQLAESRFGGRIVKRFKYSAGALCLVYAGQFALQATGQTFVDNIFANASGQGFVEQDTLNPVSWPGVFVYNA